MASFFKNLTRKEDPTIYQNKDGHLKGSTSNRTDESKY